MDTSHPHDPPTIQAAKRLRTLFGQMMDGTIRHLRVDLYDQRQFVQVLGTARELHGPQGQCSCCPRRPKLTVDGDPVVRA
jgi:hypothetical protein